MDKIGLSLCLGGLGLLVCGWMILAAVAVVAGVAMLAADRDG